MLSFSWLSYIGDTVVTVWEGAELLFGRFIHATEPAGTMFFPRLGMNPLGESFLSSSFESLFILRQSSTTFLFTSLVYFSG